MNSSSKSLRAALIGSIFMLCLVSKFASYPMFLAVASVYTFAMLVAVINNLPFSHPLGDAFRRLLVLWGIIVASSLLPIAVSLKHLPGPPRFVEYVKGYPTRQTFDASTRGE